MNDLPFWVAIPVVALLIPITAIITEALQKMKDREHEHRERLKAMEMGLSEAVIARPRENGASGKNRGAAYYGAIWTGIGTGLLISTSILRQSNVSNDLNGLANFVMLWSFPAMGVGLALLLYGVLARGRAARP
jgi:hypothetical protein